MMRSLTCVCLVALLAAPPAGASDPDLAAGIALAKEGDFEAALPKLDAASRRLQASPGHDLTVAHLYLGISYLELDQEASARGHFHEAALREPTLQLDAREFSPQVIRLFEAARREALATPAAAPTPSQVAAAEPPPKKKRRSMVPFVLGGGAAVAGLALAAGGGGSSPSATSPTTLPGATTTTTPSGMTTTTATTTTTTTLPPQPPQGSCTYGMAPATQTVGFGGGNGSCQVSASPATCVWNIESTDSWLTATSGRNGTGNGTAGWSAAANSTGSRKARLRITQNKDARCEIQQDAAPGQLAPQAGSLSFSSSLDVPGASAQVSVNGVVSASQGPGRIRAVGEARGESGRIEGWLSSASGRPGTWRFELAGAFEAGTLRIQSGEAVLVTADAVVFRLSGRVGERVAFAFRTNGAAPR